MCGITMSSCCISALKHSMVMLNFDILVVRIYWIATIKQEERDGHEVVVDEATVGSKEAHKQDQVTNLQESIEGVAKLFPYYITT